MKRTNHKVASGLLATVLLLTPSAPVLAAGTGISPVKSVPNPKVGVVHKAKSIQTNGTTTAAKVQALHGTVNPLVASGKAKRVNETDPNRLLRLGFVLQPRNEALMTSYATSGKKLTVSQFKADFAPTSTAVSTVKDFLVKGNLKVVSQTDDLLMIEGTAAQIEKALHVKFNNYQLKNYKFYANENDPVLPTEVKVALKGIIGLNQTPYSTVPVHKYVDYGQNDYFTPDAVRSSYGMIPAYGNGIDGSNRNIAILMTGDYSDDDVKKFSQTFGIPYNASKFVRRHVPGTSPAYGIDEESTLDVQWAHAIAPGATITEYETGTLDDVNLYAGLDTIINSTPTTDVINMSFGAPESFLSPNQLDTWHSKFVEAVAKGITPIASSGDNGAFAREFPVETVSSPASDPFVLAVGGTTLALDEKNNRTNETAWGEAELGSWDPGFTWGSGGGYSTVFSDFTGQTAQKRGVPDVSMLAQNIEMYEEQDGGWFTAAGTSFSGPMWSGIIALAAQKANHGFGWIRPAINNIATNADTSNLFRDITEGNNGDYSASAGWDPVTGWGSPANGWTLVQALAAQQKNNGTAGPLISGTVVGSEAFDYSQNIMNGVGTVDLIGSGFGTAKGTVTLTDAQGNHFNVPQNNWTDSDITLNIDSDSGLFGQPNHPSKAGTYQITLKKASGETSNAIPVQLGDFYQVSHQGETPVSGIDNPIYQDVQVDLYRPDGEPDTTYPNGTASFYIGSDNYWVDEQPVFLVQQNGQSCPMNADGSFRIQVVNGQASVQVATNRVGDYHYGVESANGVFGSDPDVASFTSASSTATRLINMNTEELSYAPAGGTNYVNVALSDSYGNLVNAQDSVHVTLSDATGHVTVNDQPISAATPTDVTLDAGNAYLTVGDDKAEQITLTFTDADNQQVTPLAVTLTFTAATQIAIKSTQQQTHVPVSGSGQEQESNWQYLQVEAEDAHGTVVPFAGVSFLSVMSTGSYSGNHLGTYHVQARVNNVWQDVPSNEWDAYQLDLSQGSIAVRVSSDVADQVVYRAYIVLNTDNSMYDLGGSFVAGPADALETYVQLPHMATSPASTPQYAPVKVGVFDAFQNLIESNDTIQLTERAGGPSVSVAVRNEQGVMIPVTPHNGVWTLQMSQLMNQTVFFTSTQPGVAHFDLTDVTDNHVQAADFQIAFVNSVSTSLKAATPASVVAGGKQTVEVDMIDQNGQTVINGDDQIGLSISKHSGKVTVTDRDGNALQADANGRFVVNAHAGAALFLVTDDAAETLTYSFTDLTVTRVSATSVTGMFAAPAKYVLSSIAPASLGANKTAQITVTAQDNKGQALAGSQVYLLLTQAVGGGSAAVEDKPLTDQPQLFTTDANGQVTITYQTPQVLPNGGIDTIKAQDVVTRPKVYATTTYTFATAAKFAFSPATIATQGSLNVNQQVPLTVTATDNKNNPLGNTTVYLKLDRTPDGGKAVVGETVLTDQLTPVMTDPNGKIAITYTTPAVLPSSGIDTITVQDASKNPHVKQTSAYTYATTSSYAFSGKEIATAGTLAAGASTKVTVKAQTASKQAIGNTTLYLSLNRATNGGTAKVGDKTLTNQPQAFVTDATTGTVEVTYTAPNLLPSGGIDSIVVQNTPDSKPRVKQMNTYTFAAVASFVPSASAIAPQGTLAGNGKATVTFTAKDAHKNALANTIVYLSLNQVENGGVATVGETTLTKEPQPFATDANGNVSINYTAPASLPGGGIDTITIQDAPTNPHVKATNSYTFTALSKLVYSASTLAATGTLKANDQTTVTVQAQDAAKHPLANTIVYLSVQSPGGIALVGDTALTATPQAFVTNEAGLISITYTAPQTLPNGGTVSVIAQETTNKPHVKASSSYTFAKISKWVGNATIAATGSLKAGDKQTVTMVVQDASKHPIGHTTVYLSLTSTGTGGGKAMVGDTALNGTLQAFTTDEFGQIIITYIASDLLPHRVTDTITCADSTKKTVRATTTYTY